MLVPVHPRFPRTTIALKPATKDKLNRHRAPGQCYDCFLSQLLDLWENESSRFPRFDRRFRGQ
jgi:hypothetical protein